MPWKDWKGRWLLGIANGSRAELTTLLSSLSLIGVRCHSMLGVGFSIYYRIIGMS